MRLLSVYLRWSVCLALVSGVALGQQPESAEPIDKSPEIPTVQPGIGADAWAEIIRATVIAALPEKNVLDKHWGQTTPVLSRYEIKTRKGRLSVRPKTKQVNHGFWQRQTVTILEPDQTLQIDFQDVQRLPNGRLVFTMQVVMRARVNTEFEHWAYGVKGLNGQVEADVTVAVETACSFDLTTVQAKGDLLPSIQLVPEVTDLELKVRDIDARKIGVIGGWAAEEIGDSSRSTVNSILNEFEAAILKDLRRKIEKNTDRLKISPSRLLGASKPPPETQKPKSTGATSRQAQASPECHHSRGMGI